MNAWIKKLPAVVATLAIMIALTPAISAHALGAPTGSVTGMVKSANTGIALQGVTVRVFDMHTAELVADVVTNDEGVLDFSELPLGLFQVTVVAPEGYASAAGPLVSLTEEQPAAEVAFDLEALPGGPAIAAAQMSRLTKAGLIIGGGLGVGLLTYALAKGTN